MMVLIALGLATAVPRRKNIANQLFLNDIFPVQIT